MGFLQDGRERLEDRNQFSGSGHLTEPTRTLACAMHLVCGCSVDCIPF